MIVQTNQRTKSKLSTKGMIFNQAKLMRNRDGLIMRWQFIFSKEELTLELIISTKIEVKTWKLIEGIIVIEVHVGKFAIKDLRKLEGRIALIKLEA